jgi:hypothetical protein
VDWYCILDIKTAIPHFGFNFDKKSFSNYIRRLSRSICVKALHATKIFGGNPQFEKHCCRVKTRNSTRVQLFDDHFSRMHLMNISASEILLDLLKWSPVATNNVENLGLYVIATDVWNENGHTTLNPIFHILAGLCQTRVVEIYYWPVHLSADRGHCQQVT